MNNKSLILVAVVLFGGGLLAGAALQEKKTTGASHQGGDDMGMMAPKVMEEHKHFEKMVGTWDATMEMNGQKAPGTETNRLICGGLWIVSDYKSTFMGMPFEGHYVGTYDPMKKKYVSIWVDSFQTNFAHGEGTYDKATKTFTQWIDSPTPQGTMKMKEVCQMQDDDNHTMTMYNVGADGKEEKAFTITYKRKK